MWREEETGEPSEKPLEQGENQQQTQPTYGTGLESDPVHNIGGRQALSILRHPCPPSPTKYFYDGWNWESSLALRCEINLGSGTIRLTLRAGCSLFTDFFLSLIVDESASKL